MKYVSLDIETTGLDKNKNQIVEVGAVLDEIGSTTPIEELPKFRAVLLHDEMVMGPYCANLHRDLWQEISKAQKQYGHAIDEEYGFSGGRLHGKQYTYYCRPEMFERLFHCWLNIVLRLGGGDYTTDNSKAHMYKRCSIIKINVAGKNPGSFDIPFLKALPRWIGLVEFHRRILDPASHCIQPDDEHIPDLQECLKQCGLEGTVSHTAVDDAIDIIRVIRQRRIGEPKQKAVCPTCTVPACRDKNESIFNCSTYTTFSAEFSSCDMCGNAAYDYRDGRYPEKPCHRFNPKN